LACNKSDEQLEITFTSWRIDDVVEMDRINALYTLKHPDVTIRFDSYDPMFCDSINTNPRPGMNLLLPVKKIHIGGETAIVQGANDEWILGRIVFSKLGACFYGGETARKALIAGTA
jgi:hypothetical protein